MWLKTLVRCQTSNYSSKEKIPAITLLWWIIPSEYDQYFKDIPSDKTTRDSLPEPDTMEESEDSNVE